MTQRRGFETACEGVSKRLAPSPTRGLTRIGARALIAEPGAADRRDRTQGPGEPVSSNRTPSQGE